ncbi:hypothetical protein AB0M02_18690 [Actinoplanes sp. NPDC051861]|uniref:hypothetical protein n=1 Tax=Actinoplanes sp. NPDC051861 TaxID=3155170 RepID=UPI0034465A3F
MSLARDVADKVARHLVAAGQIIDDDSELALQHAIAARRLASRISVVREAVGLAAYAAGDWTTAIAELRTYHRMTGKQTHLAELADCERALGRPERAIDLFRGADVAKLEKGGAIELLIVAAGARGDLGQHDAAVAMLQVRELTADEQADWTARLRYAYADALLAADRRDEAREWFSRAAAADEDQLTDAAERLLELDGVSIEGDDLDEDDDETAPTDSAESDRDEDDEDDESPRSLNEDDDEDDDESPRGRSEDDYDEDDYEEGAALGEGGLDDGDEDDFDEDDYDEDDLDLEDERARLAGTDVNSDGLDAPQVTDGVTGSEEEPAPAGGAEGRTGGVADSAEKPRDEFVGRPEDERPQA